MIGYLLHAGAIAQCPHQGIVTITSGQSRVLVNNQAVATAAGTWTVAGCTFAPGSKPQPCVDVVLITVSTRIKVDGSPALLQSAPGATNGTCRSAEQLPQGPAMVSTVQVRTQGE